MENSVMETDRIPWALTVALCAVAALLLVLNGYIGYSITVGAVGLAAAINLT